MHEIRRMNSESPTSLPVALTIAGFDSSGGAGILADCSTFEALGCYPVAAATAVVAQRPGNVASSWQVPCESFSDQVAEISKAFPLAAAKTGMLSSRDIVESTVGYFQSHPQIPLVIDPVIRSSSGFPLIDSRGLEMMQKELFPLALLITPNLPEAELLLNRQITNREETISAAKLLRDSWNCAVLLKGGHLEASHSNRQVFDVLAHQGDIQLFSGPRLDVPDLHGTGCTLSAAITAELAQQQSLASAVERGRTYVQSAMQHHLTWQTEAGDHPTHALGKNRRD